MAGVVAGNPTTNSLSASVPPVDEPKAIILSVVLK